MPIDPSVLLLGLQPQARVPYDAPDVVAERQARVQQLREAAKAKQDAEYENQLYDWAVKSNLGPDGQPDLDGAQKALWGVSPQAARKFATAVQTGKKQQAETYKLTDDHNEANAKYLANWATGIDQTNYGDRLNFLQQNRPDLAQALQLPPTYDPAVVPTHLKTIQDAGTAVTEQNRASEATRKLALDGEYDKAIAKWVDAHPELKDDDTSNKLYENFLGQMQNLGAPQATIQPWRNKSFDEIRASVPNVLTPPHERTQEDIEKARLNLDAIKSAAEVAGRAQTATDRAQAEADRQAAAKATADYRAEMIRLGYARLDKTKSGADVGDVSSDVRTTMSGKTYVDLGDYETPTMRQAARDAAKKAGLMVLDKATGDSLRAGDTAKSNIAAMWSKIQSKLPKDASGRVVAGPANKLSQWFQTDPDLAAFNSWRAGAIQAVQALVEKGMGFRLTTGEIKMIMDNDMPQVTDTYGTAYQRVNNLLTLLQDKENAALTRDRSTLVSPGGTAAPAAAKHYVGEKVTLRNGQTITISAVHPDGSFEGQ